MNQQTIRKSAIIITGFLLMVLFDQILETFSLTLPRVSESRYVRTAFARFVYYSPMIIAVLIALPKNFIQILGLGHPPVKHFAYALLSCLPLFIIYPLFFDLKLPIDPYMVFNRSLISPAFEEICYRALFFGSLYGILRWKLWAVVLLNAAAFSFGHLYQAYDAVSIFFTVLVTSVACIWWGWMYVRWQYNLWFPLFLHIIMNFSFELFQVSGGAAGGGIASYVGRVLVIAISVGITLKYTQPMAPLVEEEEKPLLKPFPSVR